MSTLANFSVEPVITLIWGYWLPFLLFMAIASCTVSAQSARWIMLSLAAGITFRLGYGLWVYWKTWGLPTFSDFLFSRYDEYVMSPYMDATFGSIGATASICVIVLPVLFSAFLYMRFSLLARLCVAASITVVMLNLFITGSRAAILITPPIILLALLVAKVRLQFVLLPFLLFAGFLFLSVLDEDVIESFQAALLLDASQDNSVSERFASIKIGLGLMLNYPLGVGPGMSYQYNIHGVSHQFAVSQGSELGLIGMMAVIFFSVIVFFRFPRVYRGNKYALTFYLGAFVWLLYAMIANISVNSGPTIPWIGLLVCFLALSHATERVNSTIPPVSGD